MFSTHSSVELDQTVVGEAYARLAGVYDWFFGLALQAGRETPVGMIPPGADVLEVGVGSSTGPSPERLRRRKAGYF